MTNYVERRPDLTLAEFSQLLDTAVVAALNDNDPSYVLKGVVSGNEASDADSIVCALTFAYYLTITECHSNEIFIPLISCKKEEAELRQETVYMLKKAGVDIKDLVYRDHETDRNMLLTKAAVYLVDHNDKDDFYSKVGANNVVRIVDHHYETDAMTHRYLLGGTLKNIGKGYRNKDRTKYQICGSCSTLITEVFLKYQKENLLERDDGAVAVALQGVLLIDNHNFDEEAGKATERDVASYEVLAKHVNLRLCDEENNTQHKYYATVNGLKFDQKYWDDLAPERILVYDFKRAESSHGNDNVVFKAGIPSINCTITTFVSKPGWYKAIADIVADPENKYYCYMVLSNGKTADGKTKRGVIFFSNDCTVTNNLVNYFQHGMGGNDYDLVKIMDLPGVPEGKSGTAIAFDQNDITKSRKQYRPDMQKFLNTI